MPRKRNRLNLKPIARKRNARKLMIILPKRNRLNLKPIARKRNARKLTKRRPRKGRIMEENGAILIN
jgi:hypothetical protein